MILHDVLLGSWIVLTAIIVYVVLPTLALGRANGRSSWTADGMAGAAWALLATAVLVPPLARFHLFNWMTSLFVPLAWPTALWFYRYRGAPLGEFRRLCHETTLWVLSRRPEQTPVLRSIDYRSACAMAALVAAVFWRSVRELRMATAADYATLDTTRRLLTDGQQSALPAASVVAIVAQLSASDPMQVMRFLNPLAAVGCALAAGVLNRQAGGRREIAVTPLAVLALAALLRLPIALPFATLFAGLCALLVVVLAQFAAERVHRRERWHLAAAASVALWAWMQPAGFIAAAPMEYDAAARVAMRIGRSFTPGEYLIVAPPEQQLQLERRSGYYELSAFVREYAGRTGNRAFRFDLPARHLFVFVEKKPLAVPSASALARVSSGVGPEYVLTNERARMQKEALELCEAYGRTHPGARVFYDDPDLRVYHFLR